MSKELERALETEQFDNMEYHIIDSLDIYEELSDRYADYISSGDYE